MIYDSLHQFSQYENLFPQTWKKIETFLSSCSAETPEGRYELDGDRVYASVQNYQTREPDWDKLEIHQKYIDIQLLLAGEETIIVRSVEKLKETEAYDAGRDVAFYHLPAGDSDAVSLRLIPGRFAMFFQKEGHMPGLAPKQGAGRVVKVVIKIAI